MDLLDNCLMTKLEKGEDLENKQGIMRTILEQSTGKFHHYIIQMRMYCDRASDHHEKVTERVQQIQVETDQAFVICHELLDKRRQDIMSQLQVKTTLCTVLKEKCERDLNDAIKAHKNLEDMLDCDHIDENDFCAFQKNASVIDNSLGYLGTVADSKFEQELKTVYEFADIERCIKVFGVIICSGESQEQAPNPRIVSIELYHK